MQDSTERRCMGSFLRSQLFYNRLYEPAYWNEEFKLLGRGNEVSDLEKKMENPGVISVYGRPRAGKSVLVRRVYYKTLRNSSWRECGAFQLGQRAPSIQFERFLLALAPGLLHTWWLFWSQEGSWSSWSNERGSRPDSSMSSAAAWKQVLGCYRWSTVKRWLEPDKNWVIVGAAYSKRLHHCHHT